MAQYFAYEWRDEHPAFEGVFSCACSSNSIHRHRCHRRRRRRRHCPHCYRSCYRCRRCRCCRCCRRRRRLRRLRHRHPSLAAVGFAANVVIVAVIASVIVSLVFSRIHRVSVASSIIINPWPC